MSQNKMYSSKEPQPIREISSAIGADTKAPINSKILKSPSSKKGTTYLEPIKTKKKKKKKKTLYKTFMKGVLKKNRRTAEEEKKRQQNKIQYSLGGGKYSKLDKL